jgi:hypothetical protein
VPTPIPTPTPVVRQWNVPPVAETEAKIRVGVVSSAIVAVQGVVRTNDPALSTTTLKPGEELLSATVRYSYIGWGDQTITPGKEFYLEQGVRRIPPVDPSTVLVSNPLDGKVKDKETKTGNLAFLVNTGENFDTLVYTYDKESLRIDLRDEASRPVAMPSEATAPAPVDALVPAAPTPGTAQLQSRLDQVWGNDWPAAISLLEELRQRDADSREYTEKLYGAYISYGDALVDAGDKKGAAVQYSKAAQLVSERGEANARLQALTPTPAPPTSTVALPTVARPIETAAVQAKPAVPTVPAAAPRPSGPSPAVQAYLDWLLPKTRLASQSLQGISTQSDQLAKNPRLLSDSDWVIKTGLAVAIMDNTGKDMQSYPGEVPPEARRLDAIVKDLGRDLVYIAAEYTAGIDGRSAARLNNATTRMNGIPEKTRRATAEIEALKR